jgi:hypothetical protein
MYDLDTNALYFPWIPKDLNASSVHKHSPSLRSNSTGCDVDESGFARAIMSEQTDDLARRNRQMLVMQSRSAPKLNMYAFQH